MTFILGLSRVECKLVTFLTFFEILDPLIIVDPNFLLLRHNFTLNFGTIAVKICEMCMLKTKK